MSGKFLPLIEASNGRYPKWCKRLIIVSACVDRSFAGPSHVAKICPNIDMGRVSHAPWKVLDISRVLVSDELYIQPVGQDHVAA